MTEVKLNPDEIYEGLVYTFISEKLKPANGIEMKSETEESTGKRPFVCVKLVGDVSYWAEITSQRKLNDNGDDLRLPVLKECRKTENNYSKSSRWIDDPQYIHGCLYKGPNIAFCNAGDDTRGNGKRRYVSLEGVQRIKDFFNKYKNSKL